MYFKTDFQGKSFFVRKYYYHLLLISKIPIESDHETAGHEPWNVLKGGCGFLGNWIDRWMNEEKIANEIEIATNENWHLFI